LRDVAYLDTSVRLLRELRKVDWRERSKAICRSIDEAMPDAPGLKILLLSRLHPNVAYVNLHLLAAARPQPASFIVCSMGQQAIQRANEYRSEFRAIGAHDVGFVNAEIGTPSCELIEQFALSCQRRGAPASSSMTMSRSPAPWARWARPCAMRRRPSWPGRGGSPMRPRASRPLPSPLPPTTAPAPTGARPGP
jgi:hypothetical protein